jgi:hypothetical protein
MITSEIKRPSENVIPEAIPNKVKRQGNNK